MSTVITLLGRKCSGLPLVCKFNAEVVLHGYSIALNLVNTATNSLKLCLFVFDLVASRVRLVDPMIWYES